MADGTTPQDFTVTTGPLPASDKIHVESKRFPGLAIAMREIRLDSKDDAPVRVYDPSGPYTDPAQAVAIPQGLPPGRRHWTESELDLVRDLYVRTRHVKLRKMQEIR